MAIEADICENCNKLIIYGDIKTGSCVACDNCDTKYIIIEVWNSEELEYNRFLEQSDHE